MRKLLIIAATVALCACTPEQIATLENTYRVDISDADTETLIALPDVPIRLDPGRVIAVDGTIQTVAVAGPCGEWYHAAMAAGWTPELWPRLARIMHRESRCQPWARNRSGASGLLQIMPMWAASCGGTRADLLVAGFNLACGRHILSVQGWSAWSL